MDTMMLLRELSGKLAAQQGASGVKKAKERLKELEDVQERAAASPGHILSEVSDALKSFIGTMDQAIANPKSLVPSGGLLARAGTYYAKRVAVQLAQLRTEAQEVLVALGKLSASVKATFAELGRGLRTALRDINRSLETMLTLPSGLEQEAAKVHRPSDVANIDLRGVKEALDLNVLTASLGELRNLKGALSPVFTSITQEVESLAAFVARAPDRVRAAFECKLPCCVLGLVSSQAPVPLKALLERLEAVKGLDLRPLVETLGKTSGALGTLEVDQVKAPLESFSKYALEELKPLEELIEAANEASPVMKFLGLA